MWLSKLSDLSVTEAMPPWAMAELLFGPLSLVTIKTDLESATFNAMLRAATPEPTIIISAWCFAVSFPMQAL